MYIKLLINEYHNFNNYHISHPFDIIIIHCIYIIK